VKMACTVEAQEAVTVHTWGNSAWEREHPALIASARARYPRSQEKCEHLPGAKQLTRDIYDRIIQMCENERCAYDKTAVASLHENLTGFDPCI
jgi:hypothetical protein